MPYSNINKQREYQKEWIANRRLEWFSKSGGCVKCGETDVTVLVIHHKDKSLKEDHRIWSWSESKRLSELEKCEVLCDKCHKDLHKKLNRFKYQEFEHGTTSRYNSLISRCRCDLCKKANTKAKSNQRKRRLEKLCEPVH